MKILARVVLNIASMIVFAGSLLAQTPPDGNIARVVIWRIKPGMKQQFEEGYKRHLQWHRDNHDTWSWCGWNIVSGDRFGYFMDGTFFHSWAEVDAPVAPAEDRADNARNVSPYADIVSVAMYESVPSATRIDPARLSASQPEFVRIEVQPGRGREFESVVMEAPRGAGDSTQFMLLRPLDGTSDYLLLLPGEKDSDLAKQAAFTSHLLESVARADTSHPLVIGIRAESASFRPELSNIVTK